MNTLTIPKNLINTDDLVVLSRIEYEDLLRGKDNPKKIVFHRDPSFKIPKKHKQFYDDLDKELGESLQEIAEGKVSPIFNTAKEAIDFLHSRKKIYSK